MAKKLSKANKKFIRNNYKDLSMEELAKKTKLHNKTISKYLRKLGKTQKMESSKQVKIKNLTDLKIYLLNNLTYLIAIAFILILVYANSLGGEFVSDDIAAFKNNPAVRDFSSAVKSRELQIMVYAVIYSIFKLNPVPLHLISLTLHIINTVLVFALISSLFSKKIALYATPLFALHPVNSEVVDWISGNLYLQSMFNLLATSFLYIFYRRTNQNKYLVLSIVTFSVLLIFGHDVRALMIPPILLVIDQFFIETRINTKTALKMFPYFVISAVYLYFLRSSVTLRFAEIENTTNQASTTYLQRLPYTLFEGTKLLIFPKDLTLYHEGQIISQELYILMIVFSFVLLITIFIYWRTNRRIAGLILFILASLAHVLSPIQVAWFIADRYLYFGSVAFSILLVMLFFRIESSTKIKRSALILTIIFCSIYGIRTFIRNIDWQTRKNLWESTARVSPNSYRVYNNLGDVYGLEGNTQAAIKAFEKAIEIQPNYADAFHNLGNTYLQIGELDAAEAYLTKSFEINPNLYQALFKLGIIEYNRGNPAGAKSFFEKTLELNPQDPSALNALQIIEQESR